MRIKDHRQMMRSLTDPLNIPKLRALLEAHPVLTQEEFRTRQNMAEGGVPQLVQPGPGYKPGGLVEPGVMYYGIETESGYPNVMRMKGSKTWYFSKGTGDNKIYKSGFDSPKAASDWGKKQKYKGPEVGEWERTEKYRKKISKAQTIKLNPTEQKIYREYLKVNPNAKEYLSELRMKIRDKTIGWDQIEKIKKRGGTFVGERFENPKYIKIVKAELNKIKKQKNNRNLFEFTEDSKWFKNLKNRLGMHSRTAQELLNHVIEQEFPGSYSGKWANSQFRNDIVVNDFIEYLKNHGEFDGYEKYGKATQQFIFPDKQTGRPRYDYINKSWKGWLDGDFEVPGIDRGKLKAELKKRKINWDEIKNWEPRDVRKKGLEIRSQLQFLNNLNSTQPNLTWQEVKKLYEKEGLKKKWDIRSNTFNHRITQLTELKNSGVYAHSNGNTQSVPGVEKNRDGRSPWLKAAFSQTFRTNYSILTNLGDRFLTKGDKLYNPTEGRRLHNAAEKFFGTKGVFHKVAGEGEHALSRAFDFNNVDHQLKINSLVRGDLNQFKRLNFDTPVLSAYHEYNASGTSPERRAELKFQIEDRKKMMNALTGGETKGIVAKGIVNFKYGPERIAATSDVVPIDKLMEQGKFNVEDYVTRGQSYLDEFTKVGTELGLVDKGTIRETALSSKGVREIIEKIGCPGLAAGGRASFKDGSTCYTQGMDKIQTGKITTPGEKANFTKLAQTLGPDGWKFVGIDYDAAVKTKGPVASILRSVAKAAPKTTGALAATGRFLFHPVEMGMLPLFLAGDALYQNYANKRDLQKVLDEIPLSGEYGMPQYKKDLIMEGYIQQARDKGGVGLETYAIDQPNISGALEKFGFGDPNFLAQKAGEAIAGKREEERQAYEAERERQRKIYDIDAPMMAKGGRVSYLDGGIVSLLKK